MKKIDKNRLTVNNKVVRSLRIYTKTLKKNAINECWRFEVVLTF